MFGHSYMFGCSPVSLDTPNMLGYICMFGDPYICLDGPKCYDTPICLLTPLYVWMTKHDFFVLCVVLLYLCVGHPHMFGCPPYVLMAKHAFFVFCVTLLTLFSLLQCPIYCPKSLTVSQLDSQHKLKYNDMHCITQVLVFGFSGLCSNCGIIKLKCDYNSLQL